MYNIKYELVKSFPSAGSDCKTNRERITKHITYIIIPWDWFDLKKNNSMFIVVNYLCVCIYSVYRLFKLEFYIFPYSISLCLYIYKPQTNV